MATIAVRIADETRDALLEKAQRDGVTLSDLIRERLEEAVFPVRSDDTATSDFAPTSMDSRDRHMFSMLHRILARVLDPDENLEDGDRDYQLKRARTLERGYTLEYGSAFAGIDPELSMQDCTRVKDILDMFRFIDFSVAKHAKAGTEIEDDVLSDLVYRGFDFNNTLEGQMADYVEFLIDSGRWQERRQSIQDSDGGNSHSQTLDIYLRMLAEYRRISEAHQRGERWDHFLTQTELESIADATVHPSHRGQFKRKTK
ncbi:hypothetical protein B0I08_11030 [Glaciihabitans tibetensis]|uniref:YfbU family protein n=1 Tax=Glaciihabitans tibetensis TaxID=1266600 RepID=A0A2T0V5P8_9MICO|nr:YfbU family protein [Glaciihabitans tibetensis]PRY65398.1 hypothetical protein B0I08_11030 [Glaciihabitans tibetensis]